MFVLTRVGSLPGVVSTPFISILVQPGRKIIPITKPIICFSAVSGKIACFFNGGPY
jgi:hypothetical protein